jgi:hypothetical protein
MAMRAHRRRLAPTGARHGCGRTRGLIGVGGGIVQRAVGEPQCPLPDGFRDWDYVPPDETCPFEYKPSDWGWLNGRLVALDSLK